MDNELSISSISQIKPVYSIILAGKSRDDFTFVPDTRIERTITHVIELMRPSGGGGSGETRGQQERSRRHFGAIRDGDSTS